MKEKIYKLLSKARHSLLAAAFTMVLAPGYAQVTYSFNYTGGSQTLNLSGGTYSIQCWGGDGYTQTSGYNGKGGYAAGIFTLASTQTVHIYVGGMGSYPAGGVTPNAWTFNGGGIGYPASNAAYGNGGGATDVRTVGGAWDNSASLASRVIVAGGGGAGRNSSYIGGNGGGLTGGTGTYYTPDQAGGPTGGSQTAGGSNTGYTSGLTLATLGKAATWDGSTPTANWFAGGGGGYYGGATGRVAGGGGSSYIGGVTSGTTIMFGQPGFVTKPITSGDGLVIITELCSIELYAANTTNSLNPMICSGQNLTLTTNAISNYSWSTGATSSSLVVSPTSNTVYVLTATSPSNCTASKSISVAVNGAPPVLSVSQSATSTCLGNTLNVSATGALTYTWSHGITNNVTFTPAATAVYTVMGQNGCGITQATAAVSISQLPVTGVATPSNICENATMQLSATGATSYTWEPTNQTGSIVASTASATTVFTVTGESGNCMGQHTFTVVTRPNPTINIAVTETQVCLGTPVTLTLTGASTYTWVQQNLSGSIVTDTPTISTLYQVTGTNSVNCVSGNNILVLVDKPPVMNTNLTSTNICNGGQVQLFATGATSYTWSTGVNTSSILASPVSFSVYSVTGGHNTNTCTAVEQFTVNPVTPYLDASPSTAMCMGAQITLTAGPGTGITWNPGGSFPILSNISPASTTVYTVTAMVNTLNVNCPAVNMVTVTVHPNPSVTINAPQTSICRNDPITLTAQGAQSYSWSTNQAGASVTYTSGSSGTKNITVEGTDNNGCKSTGSLLLQVTPCTGLSERANAEVQIYPNPSTGAFVVKSIKSVNIIIYNALGQPLKTSQINATTSLEMNELASGLYFVNIDDGNSTIVKTVVVNR